MNEKHFSFFSPLFFYACCTSYIARDIFYNTKTFLTAQSSQHKKNASATGIQILITSFNPDFLQTLKEIRPRASKIQGYPPAAPAVVRSVVLRDGEVENSLFPRLKTSIVAEGPVDIRMEHAQRRLVFRYVLSNDKLKF